MTECLFCCRTAAEAMNEQTVPLFVNVTRARELKYYLCIVHRHTRCLVSTYKRDKLHTVVKLIAHRQLKRVPQYLPRNENEFESIQSTVHSSCWRAIRMELRNDKTAPLCSFAHTHKLITRL